MRWLKIGLQLLYLHKNQRLVLVSHTAKHKQLKEVSCGFGGGVKGYYKLSVGRKGERSASSNGSESHEGTDAPCSQASANASRGQGRKDLTKIVSFSAGQALP